MAKESIDFVGSYIFNETEIIIKDALKIRVFIYNRNESVF